MDRRIEYLLSFHINGVNELSVLVHSPYILQRLKWLLMESLFSENMHLQNRSIKRTAGVQIHVFSGIP